MVAGITGHQRLEGDGDWAWVRGELLRELEAAPRPLTGMSSLAIGADQLFADVVLELGGELRAIVPFDGYERTFDPEGLRDYRVLLGRAASVETVSTDADEQAAYLAAGSRLIDLSDRLIAVWDGKPAKGEGGTADAVAYALSRDYPVTHINPVSRLTMELAR